MFKGDRDINAEKIESISRQIKSGAQYENPIIELKREFWDVSTNEGKDEFTKDLTVMANSQYGAGNIIVGIDGDTGDFHDIKLPLDAADLANIINRKVLEPFTVEFFEIPVNEKNIVVVHIPQSYNKPHMLRSHKNREMFIPVRKGTRTQPADKYDLDRMYTEREKTVIPPYRLEPFTSGNELTINPSFRDGVRSWDCIIYILNSGSRVNMLVSGSLTLLRDDKEEIKLVLSSYFVPTVTSEWQDILNNNFLKIAQNDAKRVNMRFAIEDQNQYTKLNAHRSSYSARITIKDITGHETRTNLVSLNDGRNQNVK